MSDLPLPTDNVEILGHVEAPRLSNAALAQYRELLSRPGFEQENPVWFARLKASVDTALAVTGQQLDPDPDRRSPAQAHFDRALAMEPSPQLVEIALRDSKGEAPNPAATANALEGIGMTYKGALEAAQRAVDRCPALAGVRVENLPAQTLAVLARFGEHVAKYQGKRPA
jgi:hypothetical protein